MDPKSNHKLVILVLLTSSFPAGFLCESDDEDYTSSCGQPFGCGSIGNITYPFWNTASVNESQLILCGHPGFGLRCRDNTPILYISQLPYRLLKISFFNYTLKLARHDLFNNSCLPILLNTTLDSKLFPTPPNSNYDYDYLTLYYDCSSVSPKLPNQFTCDLDGKTTTNLFRIGSNTSTGLQDADFSCSHQITVPVDESAVQALGNPTASPINALQTALATGFWVNWSADNARCEECERLGGKCTYSNNSKSKNRTADWRSNRTPEFDFQNNANFNCKPSRERTRENPRGGSIRPDSPPNTPAYDVSPATSNHNATGQFSHRRSNQSRIIFGAGFGAIAITLGLILLIWRCKTRNFAGGLTITNVEKFLLENGSLTPKRYRFSEIKNITKSFNEKLGQGGYGSVYKGVLPNGGPVAVKVLLQTYSNDEEFINEVASISKTSHINIVSLLGFCYETNKRALVYEFMPNKSLDKFINNTNTSLDVDILYKIATGVAKGLEYLHKGCNTSIIHFDIKPQNILLDESFNPKISDFGLAKLCKKKTSIMSVLGTRGTVGYIAPEVFSRNFGGVSHKSDVYSYGIMILEMARARKFLEVETVQSSENYFPDKIYEHVILGHGIKLVDYIVSMVEQEDERLKKMFWVGFWCIQTMSLHRPSMSKVVELLEGHLESIPIPPKPFLFNSDMLGEHFSPSLSIHVEIQNTTQNQPANNTSTSEEKRLINQVSELALPENSNHSEKTSSATNSHSC